MKRPEFTQEQLDWLCFIIGDWYLIWKHKMTDNEKTHRLGYAKEQLKLMIYEYEDKTLYEFIDQGCKL